MFFLVRGQKNAPRPSLIITEISSGLKIIILIYFQHLEKKNVQEKSLKLRNEAIIHIIAKFTKKSMRIVTIIGIYKILNYVKESKPNPVISVNH